MVFFLEAEYQEMQKADVREQLKHYIAEQILEGEDIGLSETTPLLEWGVLNSIEIVKLLGFIQQQFEVDVPANKITADCFLNIVSIADLVLELSEARSVGQ